jgi:cytochrome P450 monooxygenase
MAAVHVLYDLLEHPEYIAPLREEIVESLKANGGWTLAAANSMQKLDSFLKECQRLNPPAGRTY